MDTSMDRDSSIRKLAELIGEIRIAMLTTTTEDGSIRSRPMTTQLAKVDGELWFFTKRESPKADEIRRHRRVSLSYAKPEDNSYVSISGTAELITDQKKAQELWDPSYEQWFPQGASDPSLILIRVTVEQAEYWHAPSSAFTLQAGFVVLAPERRANPEFHAKIAMLSEYGPVITTRAPCSSCGMFHTALYHRAFPHLCGQGETPQERAEDLIRRLAHEKEIYADTAHCESVDRAVAEVQTFLEKSP
jgi:general stress protein 26